MSPEDVARLPVYFASGLTSSLDDYLARLRHNAGRAGEPVSPEPVAPPEGAGTMIHGAYEIALDAWKRRSGQA